MVPINHATKTSALDIISPDHKDFYFFLQSDERRLGWEVPEHKSQGDQIGRIFDFGVIVYSGQFFENEISSQNCWTISWGKLMC
jgi:hypothetical protein